MSPDLSDSPVYPPLATYMKVDLMFNDDDTAWLLHDKPLPDILKWVEYDADRGVLTLNTAQGKTQEFGLPIPPDLSPRLQKATKITVVLLGGDGKVIDFTAVPLNVIQTGN